MPNVLSATPESAASSLTATPDIPLGATVPGPDDFPGPTDYPGRGTTLSAAAVETTESYVPATVPFSIDTGSTLLSATPIT